MVSEMEKTLAERGGRYGDWRGQSEISQAIKAAMRNSPNWDKMPDYMRETMDLIANKFARTLNGDWTYVDNWHDTVGYAKLAEDRLIQDNANPDIVRPAIVDLNYLDIQQVFDYLLNNGVGPKEFEDFCAENSVKAETPTVTIGAFKLETASYDKTSPGAGSLPQDLSRFERVFHPSHKHCGPHGGYWWLYQSKNNPAVYDIVDITKEGLRNTVNDGTIQMYSWPQDLTWLAASTEELGMVVLSERGDIIKAYGSRTGRALWNVSQEDGA